MKTKVCTKCGRRKNVTKFSLHNTNGYIYRHKICKQCRKEWMVNWRKSHPEANRKAALKRDFNITIEDYNNLLVKQKGRCAICGKTDPGYKNRKNFCIDHDHKTGKIRGLLCNQCNHALGLIYDNITVALKMAAYLKQHKGK